MSEPEEELALMIKGAGLPQPEREYRFAKAIGRQFRFDFAWPGTKIAAEVEGGTWSKKRKSRHTTSSGYRNDCEKYNCAVILGWRVLRFTSDMVESGEALRTLERALKGANTLAWRRN